MENIMELMRYNIVLNNAADRNKPYAFRIMKAAYDLAVRGECRYAGQKLFIITAEGEKKALLNFIARLKDEFPEAEVGAGFFENISSLRYTEFDIIPDNNPELLHNKKMLL